MLTALLTNGVGCSSSRIVWGNESGVGKWRTGKPELSTAMNAFRGMLGIKVVPWSTPVGHGCTV
jgi:hypothetical protein